MLVHYNVASAEFPSRSDQEAMQKCVSVVLQVNELKLSAPLVIISCDGFNVLRVETRAGKRDILRACLIAPIDCISKSFKFSVTESLLLLRFLIKLGLFITTFTKN